MTGNHSDDYIKLIESFYSAAQVIVTEILNDYSDNAKCDQWFFPAFYLYRQAISEDEIEALAKCFLPDILDFFESEEGRQEFEKWKREQSEKNT